MGGVSPHISSLHGREARRAEDGPSPAAGECRCVRGAVFSFMLSCFRLHFDHVLAEVVVCAVGWVVTLPAMEMTAQATALLVLVPSLQPRKGGEKKKPQLMVMFCGFIR